MSQRSKSYPLESGRIEDIPRTRAALEALLQFHWEYYSELAFLRSRIYDSLKRSLLGPAKPYQFANWQRAIKYKYSLEPLSARGSLVDPGGRFNIGEIDTTRFVAFPALYLASDKPTALAELLGRSDSLQSLTPYELALTKPNSITLVSVSGQLESVLDIHSSQVLAAFVDLIKDFQLSPALKRKARKLGLPPRALILVRSITFLHKELLKNNWRRWPMHFDVPSSSQIFGQIAKEAGIEGILFPSALTGEPCLVVYPQNLAHSSSYVELDDPAPSKNVRGRIDAATFGDFI